MPVTRKSGVYFPVDAAFCNTQAVRQIRRNFGVQGFYAYVKLLCALLQEPTGKLSVELAVDWEDIEELLEMSSQDTKEFVELLKHYKALFIEDGYMYSPLVLQGIQEYSEAKEKYAALGRASGEARRKKAQEKQEKSE